MEEIHNAGGPQVSNHKLRWLMVFCSANQDHCGCPPSDGRRRVKMLVDCWKRSNWPDVRQNLIAFSNGCSAIVKTECCENPMPSLISLFPLPQATSPPATKKPKPSHTTPKPAPATKPKSQLGTTDAMTNPALGSPLRLIQSAAAASEREHLETYTADFENEDQHGEHCVSLCTEENIGKKMVSCVVIARPNTHPDDIALLKAKVVDGRYIQIEGPAKSKSHLEHSAKWLGVLETNKECFQATKLITALKSMVTKFKRTQRSKTTKNDFAKTGFDIGNEHFAGSDGEEALAAMPIPHTHDKTINKEKRTVTEVMVVWRAFIVGSLQDIEEDAPSSSTSDFDMMVQLMNGAKI